MNKTYLLFILPLLFSYFSLTDFNIEKTGNFSTKELQYPNMIYYYNNKLYITDPVCGCIFIWNETNTKKITSYFASPKGIYVDKTGIYVGDDFVGLVKFHNHRFKILLQDISPYGVYATNTTIYTVDQRYDHIYLVSKSTEKFKDYFSNKGLYDGKINNAKDIFIYNNSIYVVDYGNGRIEEFYKNYSYVQSFGRLGITLKSPHGIFVDKDYVYVADTMNNRIVIFSKDGYPVYIYNITTPQDIFIVNDTIYISTGEEKQIFIGKINIPEIRAYVKDMLNNYSSKILDYIALCEIGKQINISCENKMQEYENIKYAFNIGNYGEAFYKIKQSNISNITIELEEKINKMMVNISNNKEEDKKMQNSSTQNATSKKEKNESTGYYSDIALLNTIKKLDKEFQINNDYREIDQLFNNYEVNKEEIKEILTKLKNKTYSIIEKIKSANNSINSLKQEIMKKEFMIDYSKAREKLSQAQSILLQQPTKSKEIAEEGLEYIEFSKKTKSIILITSILIIASIIIFIYYHKFGKRSRYV